MFVRNAPPSLWIVIVIGYIPSIFITTLAFLTRAPIRHLNQTIPLNHTNVIDIAYWSSISGLDVYCSPGRETRYFMYVVFVLVYFN